MPSQQFLFATGIECSYPVVTGPDGKDLRIDQMAKCGHYDRWQEDFELTANGTERSSSDWGVRGVPSSLNAAPI